MVNYSEECFVAKLVDVLKIVLGIPIAILVVVEGIYWIIYFEFLPWYYAGAILCLGIGVSGTYYICRSER